MENPSTPNVLSFLVKPASYKCNLACDYCFYNRVEEIYNDSPLRMKYEVLEVLIKNAIDTGAHYISFCWQGGEPALMGMDFYRRAVELQNRSKKPFQVIDNVIQTNGLIIDREWALFLKENNFLAGISLDGPEEIHNRYRKHRGGEGSFASVMRAVSHLKQHRVRFNILTLLTDANIREPERIYSFFREMGFNFLQFINCHELDEAGIPAPFSVKGEDVGEFYCRLFDLWLKDGYPYVSIRLFEDMLVYFIDRELVSCTWNGRCLSYLVVEHNGDVYPCDFYVYPEWRLGNILKQGFNDIMGSPMRMKFADLKTVLPGECKKCLLLQFCNGDCTRFRGPGGKSEYCIALRKLAEHMTPNLPGIKEEVLRIRFGNSELQDKKIGRNQKCPCGSGMKYKHCCGG